MNERRLAARAEARRRELRPAHRRAATRRGAGPALGRADALRRARSGRRERAGDARLTGELSERSIAGQVEFWARLGRALEALMRADDVLALKRVGDAKPLSTSLVSVGTAEGRERLASYLASRPFPHFEAAPNRP